MNKSWRFRVTGRGVFPDDMLRYDRATFINEEYANEAAIGFRELIRIGRYNEIRSFILSAPNPPTIGRWNSFGWNVETEK